MNQIVRKLSQILHSPEFVAQHRKHPCDFTRNRSLTFPRLITFLLNTLNGSAHSELSRFFQAVEGSSIAHQSVTAAAFCKARKKFSHTAFKALNAELVKTFYDSAPTKTWKGFRLLAVDGSVIQTPNSDALLKHYGKTNQHSYNPAARVSQLYDVKNELTIDLQVDAHRVGEREQAVKHLNYANANDLIIYDRGYAAVWLFVLHKMKNINYCSRVTLDSHNLIKEFIKTGKQEETMLFPCTEKTLRRCRKEKWPTDPIKIRLIRIELPTGEAEVLMTSLLDQERYPHQCFNKLYQQRWAIEEDYKVLKSRMDIENFSGYSVEAILQDIHAKTLTKNIAAVGIHEAENLKKKRCQHRKKRYRINVTYALFQLKDNIVRFLLSEPPPDIFQRFIIKIATIVDARRPERSFTRDKIRKNWKKYNMAYKRLA